MTRAPAQFYCNKTVSISAQASLISKHLSARIKTLVTGQTNLMGGERKTTTTQNTQGRQQTRLLHPTRTSRPALLTVKPPSLSARIAHISHGLRHSASYRSHTPPPLHAHLLVAVGSRSFECSYEEFFLRKIFCAWSNLQNNIPTQFVLSLHTAGITQRFLKCPKQMHNLVSAEGGDQEHFLCTSSGHIEEFF